MCSDTDDTDDLLLIPPDFFLVHSEPEPPYYSIVDNLIRQVSNLQNRIETIETTSDVSLCGSYIDNSMDIRDNINSTRPSTRQHFLSQEDLYQPNSTQSTPQKAREKIKLNSLPNSPNVNLRQRYSVKFKSPQRNSLNKEDNPEILSEIDTFISNVKTIERNNTVRNLGNEFNSMGDKQLQRNVLNGDINRRPLNQSVNKDVKDTVDLIRRQSEQNVRQEHLNNQHSDNIAKVTTWRCGDDIRSVPDYGAGVRDTLYNQKYPQENHVKPTQLKQNFNSTSSGTDFTSYSTLDRSSDSSSDSTQTTAYNKYKKQEDFCKKSAKVDPFIVDQERNELLHSPLHSNALSVLSMHKKLLNNSNSSHERHIPKQRSLNTVTDRYGLLSLADIWSSTHMTQSPSKLTQKLQEEKLRRQHCEQLISELQNKNLELQEKLAVAIQVDESKNNTIQQFQEALEKVSTRMEKLNEEKNSWDKEIMKMKNHHSIEIDSANQKIQYYEKEASKALNLAHANQEKFSTLERKCSDLQKELETIENKFRDVQDNYKKEFDKNKVLSDIISQKELDLKENKTVLVNAREEIAQSRKAVEICQTEFTLLKDECGKLETELKASKNLIADLTDQKKKMSIDIQSYKSNEKTLKEALEQSQSKLESTKLELRNFYQGQLELIVENKRKEMQGQLDQERQKNLDEIKRKELSMAKTAANHIKEISEKCSLEIKLLEQKQQEEIRLYEIQASQYKKEIENLQTKLANLPEKRAQIAKQLQKVMESHWDEALKMIGSSPSSFNDNQVANTLHNVSKKPAEPYNRSSDPERYHQMRPEHFESVSDYEETPVSSRGVKNSESEIQKYINMLLNRPPGQPTEEPPQEPSGSHHNRATWHHGVRPGKPK
ncbi:putative leucine-rich repeat-containing protein DDB_G0290503 isoform X2 [Sitophilus oryzae]|uniref:Leucine-rich repeat-containing protein DDB_G0290503 isoform X2 n=1 Tax=Sitophilus oryzae TaxID=7048 RepID=A0A6J2Y8E0_SITOR|nr:putative leucine-rich repeat-containing protein DDB_G0290503 isoform X2 [Sitophilus oryzae]